MKSVIIAFAMYSKIPMPHVEWDKRSLSWALCAFPLVGVVIGAVLYGWLYLADFLDLTALKAAGAVALPLARLLRHLRCPLQPPESGTEIGNFEGQPYWSLRHYLLRAIPAGVLRPLAGGEYRW